MATIKDKNEKELIVELSEKRLALRAFRFGSSGSKARNVKEAKGLKKDIARTLTEINARKITTA